MQLFTYTLKVFMFRLDPLQNIWISLPTLTDVM